MHEGAITSVHFSPVDATKLLTNGMDACLKIIDLRTGLALETFRDADLITTQSWSKAVWSPNGRYVAAGSNTKDLLLVWNCQNGAVQKLSTPSSDEEVVAAGICGIDWGRGGSSGQQVATIDRRGKLILWA
jgi:autophagy-related protein 16